MVAKVAVQIEGPDAMLAQATAPAHARLPPGRAMLIYAHPDDEAIAIGARLPRFTNALFVQVTDGAPADNHDGEALGLSRGAYRATREAEARNAFCAGGLPHARRECLGIVDQTCPLHLPELVRELEERIRRERPDVVFTHPFEGGHADHDACAFAVSTTVASMRSAGESVPMVVESPFYFKRPGGEFTTGEFLNVVDCPERTYLLTQEERRRKQAMFAAFATQGRVLRLFGTERERYRVAPEYCFTHPPHAGPAHYESFMGGVMTATRFSELAAKALRTMKGTVPA